MYFCLEFLSTNNSSIKRSPNKLDCMRFPTGGDVNAKDQGWLTPLHRAAASRNKVLSIYSISSCKCVCIYLSVSVSLTFSHIWYGNFRRLFACSWIMEQMQTQKTNPGLHLYTCQRLTGLPAAQMPSYHTWPAWMLLTSQGEQPCFMQPTAARTR